MNDITSIPFGIVCLADYERLAEQRLDANAWAYFAGGAGDEISIRWNRESFDRMALVPRVLRSGAAPNTATTLFGHVFEHPILVAPVAFQRLADPDGDRQTAMAAAAQDAGLVVSSHASTTLEDVAAAAGPRRWFQLYMQPDRAHTLDLVRRAESAAYEALVVTVDAPVNGLRNREQRESFTLPPGIATVNLTGYTTPMPTAGGKVLDYLMASAPGWEDIAWLAANTRLPVLLKGILSADDAVIAVDNGATGLIVSNHGGRTLDTSPSPFAVLPEIVDRVAGRAPILLDGGIRRGTDVLKCVASGASAVLVGRPIVHGLAVAGALGVSHVLKLLRDELELAMALTGCTRLADADRRLLRPSG